MKALSPPHRNTSLHCIPLVFAEISTLQALSNNSSALASYFVVKNVILRIPSVNDFERVSILREVYKTDLQGRECALHIVVTEKSTYYT